jgi:hypothetical protein
MLRCRQCEYCVDRSETVGRCHGEPPKMLGLLNIPESKTIRKRITNSHREGERGIWPIVKLTDKACGKFIQQ